MWIWSSASGYERKTKAQRSISRKKKKQAAEQLALDKACCKNEEKEVKEEKMRQKKASRKFNNHQTKPNLQSADW